MFSLNFTHRSAFGSFGEGDQHGELQQLADNQLAELLTSFPTVFEEPVYPVSRGHEIDQLFQHEIKLADTSKPPPKKRLYPLDQAELAELKVQI